MADFAQLGVGGSGIDSLERWALAQFTPPARSQRRQRKEQVQDELSQLLFGVDLSPGELQVYKARLLEAIARVDGLEQGRLLTLESDIAVPRSKMMVTVGGMGWLPTERTSKSIEVSAEHEIHSRNLAKTLRTSLALDPRSVHRDFHAVGVVVARGSEGVRWGEDKVQLSQWGLDIVRAGDYPKVARLRLPPKFPTQAEMVSYRAG